MSPLRNLPRLKGTRFGLHLPTFPRTHLRWQLILSYLPLILIPLILTGLVTRNVAEQGLTLLVSRVAQERARELAPSYAQYFEQNGSWAGVSQMNFVEAPRPLWMTLLLAQVTGSGGPLAGSDVRPGQLLITDASGLIVASDTNDHLGKSLSPMVLSQGAPIIVNGKTVGTLVIGAAFGILDAQQSELLNAVNGALLLSGLLTALVAVASGIGLSWRITRPMNQLMGGVRRLAAGEWSEPLKPMATNEFGDLTGAFNTMAAELTRQGALRRQMVADVAHDLRTPLSAMLLEIEAIEAGLQSPEEAAASLREEIGFLQHLVDDLRTLSLLDTNQFGVDPLPTSLTSFLEGVFDLWGPMAEEHDRDLALAIEPTLPLVVKLDAVRMRQVVGNLIDNAIQHTQRGGHIILSGSIEGSGTAQGQGARAVIRVSDDGKGIALADLPHVFDRFYRADHARRHDSPHSGLGLSIAQRLVELHGGQITVQSVEGKGATFRISLPVSSMASPSENMHADRAEVPPRAVLDPSW